MSFLLLILLSAFAADPDCDESSANVQIDGATGIVYVLDAHGHRTLARGGIIELSFANAARTPVTVDIDLIPPSDPKATPVVPDIIIRPRPSCPPST